MTGVVLVSSAAGCRGRRGEEEERKRAKEEERRKQQQISVLALLLAAIRRSMASSCRMEREAEDEVIPALQRMEIGWPTDVRHVAHVTFDRFNGFLGLPVEFELEVPGRVPSASASVFGVSAESMQCSYDSKGNSVPTILLLMQERLYKQGGLKAEGIFRINPENSQEEHVREQLNKGIVPDDIDVHCLASLIKAWFRELPEGVLDGLSPEQVLECNTEEDSVQLVKLLLPTQASLLNWAIELMADVVEEEEINKMNARNIAMVFAPNMTQMSDPLTALMHAVQVMNLLKTLILKILREREEAAISGYSDFSCSPSHNPGDDDYNSQNDVDMSDESDITSDNEPEAYDEQHAEVNIESARRISGSRTCSQRYTGNYTEDDEDDSLTDIEVCFLRQLEWKLEDGDIGENNICEGLPSCAKETQISNSDFNIGSCFSLIERKEESSITNNEGDSEPSIIRNAEAEEENPSEQNKSNELMVECKWIS
ncbi:rho GTPase-activating protein 2 [Canna indica]|uniref:Rho GTPase-activating protein 2 n=1 Tax=Canna indica TaxID=4628 RepID=A0AAQ3QLN1_9LILI|nr:rho GTPase-activating protein 2 [Canna indica]